MRQTWRWFGPSDIISIRDITQTGAQGIVSALHHVPAGEIWTPEEIRKRQTAVATGVDGDESGLHWEVVESLPVSEDIKLQQGHWREHIANYQQSLHHLAAAGIEVICYNFMPVLDWTRTDLAWTLKNGATCMRFDLIDFAVFDLHILKRAAALEDFDEELQDAASRRCAGLSEQQKQQLVRNVVCGLPGAAENYNLRDVKEQLGRYADISADQLRRHLVDFLSEVTPIAQQLGLRLCCHPDDPPFPLLGLPRIMSTEDDYANVLQQVDLSANGITLCSGSLGARPDNDLPGMMSRLGHRVHFLHLRNVRREGSETRGSFFEAEHLGGDTDMVALIQAILHQESTRKQQGRTDWNIPFRPDHGQDILNDLETPVQPGYPLIGRLKGLAELRGVIAALEPQYAGASGGLTG